jgi:hypothetical protein
VFHRPRLLFAVHLGLFLGTAVACYLVYRMQAPSSNVVVAEPDHLLRSHLGLRSFRALYRLPEGTEYLVVSIFEVEDGGKPRPGVRARLSRDDIGGSEVRLEFMWGKVNGRMTISDNWSDFGGRADGFWEHINGIHIYGRDVKKPVWNGYEVVAYGQSDSMIEPRRDIPDETDDVALAIGRRRYVAIIAVKPCATKAEADAAVYGRNP